MKLKTLSRSFSIFLLLSFASSCVAIPSSLVKTLGVIFQQRTFATIVTRSCRALSTKRRLLSRHELTQLKQQHCDKPLIKQNMPLLETATELFHGTPGFQTTLRKTLASPEIYAKGFLYELEKAVEIEQGHDEKVVAFGEKKQSPSGQKREFDLITTRRAIECKNTSWSEGTKQKVRQQILDQQSIIAQCNEHSTAFHLLFCVCSKTRVPENWRAWFEQHEIIFYEDDK